MRTENFVSVWVGITPSRADLIDEVQMSFNEDGDYIPSLLMRNFGIPSYDEDLVEIRVFELSSRNLIALFKGCSFDTIISDKFRTLIGDELQFDVNAVVLLYDFQANVEVGSSTSSNGVELYFLGSEKYN